MACRLRSRLGQRRVRWRRWSDSTRTRRGRSSVKTGSEKAGVARVGGLPASLIDTYVASERKSIQVLLDNWREAQARVFPRRAKGLLETRLLPFRNRFFDRNG